MIFLFLLACVLFLRSDYLIDDNHALRLTSAVLLLFVAALASPKWNLERAALWLGLFAVFSMASAAWSIGVSESLYASSRVIIALATFMFTLVLLRHLSQQFLARSLLYSTLLLVIINGLVFVFSNTMESPFTGTSAHPNLLSSLLFLMIPLLLYLQKALLGWEKRLLQFTVLLCVGFIVLLGTRSVYLAVLLFGLLFLVVRVKKIVSSWEFTGLLLIIPAGILIAYILVPDHLLDSTTLRERFFIWDKTVQLIQENPIIGVGAGNWQLNYTQFGVAGFDTFEIYGQRMQRPHNDFLWLMSETGIVGVALMGMFFTKLGVDWYQSVQRKETAILVMGLISFFAISFFSFPRERIEHIVILFVMLALLHHETRPGEVPKSLNIKWGVIPLLVFALAVGIFRIQGEYHGRQLLQAANDKKFEAVLHHATLAKSGFYQYIGGETPIAAYQAEAYLRTEAENEFIQASREAAKQAPYNYEVLSNYGMALNRQEKYILALENLERAHKINPRFDGAILNLVVVNYNAGRYEEARHWVDSVHFKSEMTNYYARLINEKMARTPASKGAQ